MNKKEKQIFQETAEGQPLEDRALKEAAALFGEELMPLLGIEGSMKRIAPTEQVYLNPKDFTEDFNYEMLDGSWKHLEFESDEIKVKDLRRFRTYEAVTSQNYDVDVTTYVICTARGKKLKDRLETGINTYRVKVVRMKDRDAGHVLRVLEERQKSGSLSRQDLLLLLLTPLMDGELSQQDRITKSFLLLRGERGHMDREDLARMEAVLYTLAMKFLKRAELEQLKERMNMTILGEMIMQDGIKKGREEVKREGREEGKREGREEGKREGKEEGKREGREEGKREGREEATGCINQLNIILIGQNRFDDVKRASEDHAYQQKLIRELLPEESRRKY